MGELLKEWNGFKPGQNVKLLVETMGADHDDIEHTMPAGSAGVIDHIERYLPPQGVGVTDPRRWHQREGHRQRVRRS
ncbi:hypothetical protein ABIE79_010108 [Bradyrhizobium diazoefficiens]